MPRPWRTPLRSGTRPKAPSTAYSFANVPPLNPWWPTDKP